MKNETQQVNDDNRFTLTVAGSESLKHIGFAIRYQVYCDELGWEPANLKQLEQDRYDNHAVHCLAKQNNCDEYVGYIRLIQPQSSEGSANPLPWHRYYQKAFAVDLSNYGEVSRLAVLPEYRNIKITAKNYTTDNGYDISSGLYLCALAITELTGLDGMLCMMENKLLRRLRRFGLHFTPLSDTVELNGKRMLCYLPRAQFLENLSEQKKTLYRQILDDISPLQSNKTAQHLEAVNHG